VVDVSTSKVGINIASPVYELDVNGSIATQCVIIYDDEDNNGVFAHRNNKNNTDFALLQTSAGKTRINCKNGSGNIIFTHGSTDVKQEFDSDGNVIIQGNLFSYSDIRIKTNIETIKNALDKVTSLRGVTYNMIKDIKENPNTAQKHVGLIAQEVETIIPEAVKEENGFKTVAYGNLVSVLIEAVKELKEKFDLSKKVPLKRVGDHQELANLAAYLVSDFSAYINGEVIVIDGGEWLKGAGQFNLLEAVPEEMWDMLEMMIKAKKNS
jgi:hypothetical protein